MPTIDDLTLNEYADVARHIKGDPSAALNDPDSIRGGQALAGLVWALDRRTNPAARFETYLTMTLREVQERLAGPPSDLTPPSDDPDATPLPEAAQDAAADLTGGLTDPTAPGASPS